MDNCDDGFLLLPWRDYGGLHGKFEARRRPQDRVGDIAFNDECVGAPEIAGATCVTKLQYSCTEEYSQDAWTVTVTNLSQASLGRPSPRALKPQLRYKLNHGVVGGVYYNLYVLERGVD